MRWKRWRVKNSKAIEKVVYTFVGFCGLALVTVAILLALNSTFSMKPIMTVALAIVVFAAIVAFPHRQKILRWLMNHQTVVKIVIAVIALVAIVLRFAPLIFQMQYIMPDDLNDVGVHYYAAPRLAEGWLDGNTINYMKAYPYLVPYALTLTVFYKLLFGNIVVAILVSNLLFDAIGGLFCYLLLKKTKIRGAGWIGVLLWCINPMSIIACWFSMNLVLVNMLLMGLLYCAVCFLEALRKRQVGKTYILAAAIGLLVFVANLFRPLFTVILIALAICALVTICSARSYKQLPVLIVMILALIIPTTTTNVAVKNLVGDDILGSSGGWSFYVGSNYTSQGSWVPEDRDYFWGEVIPESGSFAAAQERIKQDGIRRYLSLSPLQIVNHLANKVRVLFGDVVNSTYDIRSTFGIAYQSKLHNVLSTIVAVFYIMLLSLTFLWMVRNYRKLDTMTALVTLSFLGLVAAFLIVEVMNRYMMIFYPLLIVYASLILGKMWVKLRHKL